MSPLEISVGEPSEPGRYVVWTPCKSLQVREWCEPSIATWHDGRWAFREPVWGWIGPLPIVHGNDCLKKFEVAKTEYVCATCETDLMFALPATISRWDSPTDKRVFCSVNCLIQSSAPDDVKTVVPQEYDL